MKTDTLLQGLPAAGLLVEGLRDVALGRLSIPACLVAIAAPRLRRSGLLDRAASELPADPELQLYELLRQAGGDAYSRYNSLLRELIRFEQALDHRLRRSGLFEV